VKFRHGRAAVKDFVIAVFTVGLTADGKDAANDRPESEYRPETWDLAMCQV
jgi:hypothetical protein